ncbi:hypothetical protein HYU16_03445 [Candidatus Woesearchaeota archaeon]|nr:hypothetical protein [Candidatus Woesearchaeota archaeon]
MSFSANPLFSQKKGAIYSFVLLIAVAVLVIGILSAYGAKFSTTPAQQFTPRWIQASAPNASVNISVSNDASSPAAIKRVDIARPSGVSIINCGPMTAPNWDCSKASSTSVSFQYADGLAAGSSQQFNINITSPAGAGNYSFTIDTYENTAGTLNVNSSSLNVSVDAHPPTIRLVNISTSTKNISGSANFANPVATFINNASITIIAESSDNGSQVGNVTLVYNFSTGAGADSFTGVPFRGAGDNVSAANMTNQSFGSASLFGYTISTSGLPNGTRFTFSLHANDTVGNYNVTNSSLTAGYNFTIDAANPQLVDVQIANNTELTTNSVGRAINTTRAFGGVAGLEYIINSSLLLNVTAFLKDNGGSGVIRAEIMDRSRNFLSMDLLDGANGSAGQTAWNFSRFNITELLPTFSGDGVYNITIRATDNVSNAVLLNFSVEVDDTPPTGAASTNLTVNGVLSEGNITLLNLSTNESFLIKLQTSNNINNVTRNVSVYGNKGLIYNLSLESGTSSGTAVWNLTVQNNTLVNLSGFCDLTGADGSQCNLHFNFSDVLGRENNTINMTLAVDAAVPNISILSPVSFTTNYTTNLLINVTVNDTVGPLRNVSFRWRNDSNVGDLAGGANISSWLSMSLGAGANAQFNSLNTYWNATLAINTLVDTNYTIEINATDSAGRNVTAFVANVIFDSSIPTNFTIVSPASNSFNKNMFNITLNATEVASGLKNVSFRLENNSYNWPWVEATQAVQALASRQTFNATQWNFTHFGGQLVNATSGNFSIRFNVTDTAGNQNTTFTVNFTIDLVPPASVTFVYPANNQNQSSNFTINVSATESNFNTVQYRWINQSTGFSLGNHSGPLTTMNRVTSSGASGTFNATFMNLTDGSSFLDGNYTIEVNVTDKAGWNTTSFIQLILDKTKPVVQISNTTAAGNSVVPNQRINGTVLNQQLLVINVTINDTGTWNLQLGNIVTTNINATAFMLVNRSANPISSNGTAMSLPTTSLGGNYSNASFNFSLVPNGVYDINVTVNDTAGNINYTIIQNITLDNTNPSVKVVNTTPASTGGVGLTGTILINATITDNLGFGPNGIHNTSVNVTLFSSSGTISASLRMERSLNEPTRWNGSVDTTTLTDGDYSAYINVTDVSGNGNNTEFIPITVQNGATNPIVKNLTFLQGIWNGMANSSTDTYTFLMNTTENATCLYSLDTSKDTYNDMLPQSTSNTMSNNVSRQHSISFGSQRDIASGGHTLYYSCRDVSGKNAPHTNNVTAQFSFGIDTRSRWNVTIPGKTDNSWPNYFQPAPTQTSANGWSKFTLSTLTTDASTLASTQGGPNVTNVLASLLQGTAAGNFTRIYAYNSSTNSWTSFRVGDTGNTFINFTGQTEFWINISAVERIELN